MAEDQKDPNASRNSHEQGFYEVFRPKWVAGMQRYGISVERFSERAVSLNLIGEKTIPNWSSGKTRSPLSGDYERAVGIVLKTFANFLKDDLNDLYCLVNHGWTRDQFWRVIKGRALDVKGQWVLSPIPNDIEPNWDDYSELVQQLINASGPLNPTHLVGVVETQPGQAAHQLNALKNHSKVIDAFSLIYHQPLDVADMAWEAFGRDLKQAALKAIQEASRPTLIVLDGVELRHLARLRHFLNVIRGNEYVYFIATLDEIVLNSLGVAESFRHDFRPPDRRDPFTANSVDSSAPRPDNSSQQTGDDKQKPPMSAHQTTGPSVSPEATNAMIRFANSLDRVFAISVQSIAFGLKCDEAKAQNILDEWLYGKWIVRVGHTYGLDIYAITDFAYSESKRVQKLTSEPKTRVTFENMPSKLGLVTPMWAPYGGRNKRSSAGKTNRPGTVLWSWNIVREAWTQGSLNETCERLKERNSRMLVDMVPTVVALEQQTRAAKRDVFIAVIAACVLSLLLVFSVGKIPYLDGLRWYIFGVLVFTVYVFYMFNHQLARAWKVVWAEMDL